MEIQVELISRSMVKPSSPTADHLRRHHLSSIDQLTLPVFMPWLIFYPSSSEANNIERYERVKNSLSKTLTVFYPLAGRLRENSHIDCNDEGVMLMEAGAKCTILDILQSPYTNIGLEKLVAFKLGEASDMVAAFQVTYFECGGMAIGVSMAHKAGDALSMVSFINHWAAIARGEQNIGLPYFASDRFFPPIDMSTFEAKHGGEQSKIVGKRFLFKRSDIAAIRDMYVDSNSSTDNQRRPTRIEALTAFIWSKFFVTTQDNEDTNNKTFLIHHPINFRPRMDPPLSENSFGNIVMQHVVAVPDLQADDNCCGIIRQMREAIKKVDANQVKKLQSGDELLKMANEKLERATKEEIVSVDFSSICGFPIYETDFGWGNPVWIGTICWPAAKIFILQDYLEGDIEALIHLKEEDMAKFEKDPELVALTSSTPAGVPSAS